MKKWFKRISCLLLISLMTIVVVSWAKRPRTTLPVQIRPGDFTLLFTHGGYQRVVRIHIPPRYTDNSPLLLLLHGGGGSGLGALDSDGWAKKSDVEGFVVIAPDGLGIRPDRSTSFLLNPATWNSGQFGPEVPRSKVDDVAFIRALLDEMKTRVPHDASRVFCTGHSNGGGMTLRLSCELPDRFTAVATVAGQFPFQLAAGKSDVPTMYIIGTADPLMPMNGGVVKFPWGTTRTAEPMEGLIRQWASVRGCNTEPVVVSHQNWIKRVRFKSIGAGPDFSVIYLEGHGHHWPGGRSVLEDDIMGPNTTSLDATSAIWEFFASFEPVALPSTKEVTNRDGRQ
jgi:polyhydroxybutyrate depolymerase